VIRYGERIRLVDPAAISWVAAEGDYVRLHTSEGEYLLRETMQGMEERLSPSSFIRIHRSTLARADFIREVRPRGRGRYVAVLQDGSRRNISRRGQAHLERALGISL
jgi:two-component system LytT family response regulator